MTVVVVGAYTRDLYMFGDRLPGPGETVDCPEYAESHGGKAANQAVAAARLGAKASLISRLGKDRFGKEAYQLFRREGVDTRHVSFDPEAGTGVGFIIVDKGGIQLITTYAGASGELSQEDIQRASTTLGAAKVLLLQGEIPATLSWAAARLAGERTTVVLNPSPFEAFAGTEHWEDVDILVLNEQEAAALLGTQDSTAVAVASATGVLTVILTQGSEGAEAFWEGSVHRIPTPRVPVVDTTGAGDAFTGSLAAGLARGVDVLQAAEHACRCAAFSVSRRYCIPSFPTEHDVPWDM